MRTPSPRRRYVPRLVRLDERVLPDANPVGPEFRVNTTPSQTTIPGGVSVARNAGGDTAAVWWAGDVGNGLNLFARLYDPAGSPRGNDFRVNAVPNPTGGRFPAPPGVGIDAGGNVVVAWEADGRDGDGIGIVARRFTATGGPAGGEFQVNSANNAAGDQRNPAVAMNAAGKFVIAWDQTDYDPEVFNGLVPIRAVHAQVYDPGGQRFGTNFLVSDHIDFQGRPTAVANDAAAAMDDAGEFVIAWVGVDDGNPVLGDSRGIYARTFGAGGPGRERRVNTTSPGLQDGPVAAADAAGNFVVVWESLPPTGSAVLLGQRYDAVGDTAGGEFAVTERGIDTTIGVPHAVAMDPDGDFVVAWYAGFSQIRARCFDRTGAAKGGEIQVNTATENHSDVGVGAETDGNFVVAWGGGLPGEPVGVFARRFGGPVPPTVPPPPPPAVPPTPTKGAILAVTGSGGTLQAYTFATGVASPNGSAITPFPGTPGIVRAATADFNGDGFTDTAAATGPGGGSLVRVIDGATGKDLAAATATFEGGFTGGLFVAAADVDADGKAEVIVSPDVGGGGRVQVFAVANDKLVLRANFFGIDDPDFRGGARVAVGDVTGDGRPEVVVGAGFLGGPRVAIFDGNTLLSVDVGATPPKLIGDFFAFPGEDATRLRNGVFVAVGDVTGDGKGELIFGGGPGGGPRVFVLDGATVAAGDVSGTQAFPVANFFVDGDDASRGGVRLAVKAVDADARADLITASGDGQRAEVFVYPGKNFPQPNGTEPPSADDFEPFDAVLANGVFVG
jgi:hypothetical protein